MLLAFGTSILALPVAITEAAAEVIEAREPCLPEFVSHPDLIP
jgi:hypothetical protein